MPIYAYRCESCGHEQDVLQKLSDAPLTDCPSCGQPALRKQVTAAGFQLKGSGWYVTDFRDKGQGKAAKKADGAESKPADGAAPASGGADAPTAGAASASGTTAGGSGASGGSGSTGSGGTTPSGGPPAKAA